MANKRYLLIVVSGVIGQTSGPVNDYPSLSGFTFRNNDGSTVDNSQLSITASSTANGSAANLLDNNTATTHAGNNSGTLTYTVDFANVGGAAATQVDLIENYTYPGNAPGLFDVICSDDGSTGTNLAHVQRSDTYTNHVYTAALTYPATLTTMNVAANDASLSTAFSPYTWKWDGTSMNANSPGSYAKFSFTGTSVGLALVASASTATLAYSIDNGPLQNASLASSSVSLASGLAAGTHVVEMNLMSSDTSANRFALACAARITAVTVDIGATITAPTLRAKRAIFFADSIGEGKNAKAAGVNDVSLSEAPAIMRALDAEYGLVAYSGQGFVNAGDGDVPALSAAYGYYSSGVSRLTGGVLSPAPDYLLCMHGTNGSPTQSNVAAQISGFRTIAPSATIIMIVPPGGFARAAITAATQAAITAGDAKLLLIDAGDTYAGGLAQFGTPSRQATDGLHPLGQTNIGLAAIHSFLIRQGLNPHRFTITLAS